MPNTLVISGTSRGDITGLADFPSAGNNYEKVYTNDSDVTYVYKNASVDGVFADGFDLYKVGGQTHRGEIQSVTVYCLARKDGASVTAASGWTTLKTNTNVFYGTPNSLGTSYATFSTTYTTNPQTGSAWTWNEVNNLQIGVKLGTNKTIISNPIGAVKCTFIYAEVSYQILATELTVASGNTITVSSGNKLSLSSVT